MAQDSANVSSGLVAGIAPRDFYVFQHALIESLIRVSEIDRRTLGRRVAGIFRQICTEIAPTISLEMGAYEANFSRWIKENLPQARAIAFEANPYVFAKFKSEVLEKKVEYINACVTEDQNAQIKLRIPRDFRGVERSRDSMMASLLSNSKSNEFEEVSVPGVCIDKFVTLGESDRVVAWIDVEGACEPVLKGSRSILQRASAIFIEVESAPMWKGQWLDTDVGDFLVQLGLVPVLRDQQRPRQFNCIYINPSRVNGRAVARRIARAFMRISTPAPADKSDALSLSEAQ